MARWGRLRSRGDVVDRRGMGPAVAAGGLGGVGVLVLLLFTFLGGGDIEDVLGQLQGAEAPRQTGVQPEQFRGEDDYEVFASTVLGSNNDTWRAIFEQSGLSYSEPRLVLFRGQTQSGCGGASAAVGPHYCPLDETIYLDETFFDELQRRFGAEGGDVAEAYVISHEVAHHVQNLVGVMEEVQNMQRAASSPEERNRLSIALELQADCYAGIWAHSIADLGVFLPGEIQEAMDAAAAVGDDRIQQRTQGRVVPESWTHGSSTQRVEWFETGFESGDPGRCSTFG